MGSNLFIAKNKESLLRSEEIIAVQCRLVCLRYSGSVTYRKEHQKILESKAKAVECNFDFNHDDFEELSRGFTTDSEFAVLSRRLQ